MIKRSTQKAGCIFLILVMAVLMPFYCKAQTVEAETKNALEKADSLLSGDEIKNIGDSFFDGIKESTTGFSKVFASMILLTFMLGVMRLMTVNNAALYAGEICLCSFCFSVVSQVVHSIEQLFLALRNFMMSALPVMTTLYSVSGAPTAAASNYASTLIVLNICGAMLTSVLVPGIKCVAFLAVVSYISKSFDFSGFSHFIRNTVGWLFGIVMCITSAVIAFQNVIALSKDGILGRTMRFAAARFIPIVGGAVSESARTLSESLRLLRSVSGVSGIFMLIAVIAAPVASLLVCRFFLNLCAALARLFSLTKTAVFFGELAAVTNLLLGVTAGISLMLIIILGLFSKAAISL
ncbi:MAG: hypothetical protein E7583_02825 [Ruminococcaceae bacterium]|nr:hypothetical protein [Oscillospiraceae bacterium]